MSVSAARAMGEIRTRTDEAIGIPEEFAREIAHFRRASDFGNYRLGSQPTKSAHQVVARMSM
jgi:hypothetical protein